jgi:acetyl esterase/lipase
VIKSYFGLSHQKANNKRRIFIMSQPLADPNPRPEADVSFVKRKFLDLPYATISATQKLDIYLPDSGEGPFPVFAHIHGGAFMFGEKRSITLIPYLLNGLKRGYAAVDINYRLSGEAIFPAAVQDVKAAIRWLRANQTKYSLDGKRIAVCGGSAGGNLVAMLGVTGNIKDFDDPNLGNIDQPSNVQAVVDMFGPIDFLKMDAQLEENGFGPGDHGEADSPESKYLGAKISDVPLKVERANPTTYIHPGIPPFLIQHGSKDRVVPVQQSIDFAKQLQDKAGYEKVSLTVIEGAEHGDPIFQTEGNIDKVFGFIDSVLK